MSDDPEASDHERSIADWALDAFFYAPAGVLFTAIEDLPAMAAKGRSRIEQQLRNAHFVGGFVVRQGKGDLERRLKALGADRNGTREPVEDEPASPAPSAPVAEPAPRPTPLRRPAAPPPDLAIPDYDTLSASQVVRRLDGLGASELEAVYRHEAATRSRRTILHRAQQLLGSEDAPAD